jgi:hypothetical protein
MHRHHVLRIEPRALERRATTASTTSRAIPLHLVRGHFEDYREHGLFGRPDLRGIYWWDAYVRGTPTNGTVSKSYEVHPPLAEEGR